MFVAVSATRNKSSGSGSRRRGSRQRDFSTLEKISICITRIRLQPFFVPRDYAVDVDHGEDESMKKVNKTYNLGYFQRIFLTLDDPLSRYLVLIVEVLSDRCPFSSLAVLYQIFMFMVILISCIVYILSTLPSLM